MKRKVDTSAVVYCNPAAADITPVVRASCAEPQTGDYTVLNFSPLVTLRKSMFRQLVDYKWRSREYSIPDDCEGFRMGTTAILYPRVSDDHKAQQIQQHNYDNFISIMAEMIQKYAPQIQKLREGQ